MDGALHRFAQRHHLGTLIAQHVEVTQQGIGFRRGDRRQQAHQVIEHPAGLVGRDHRRVGLEFQAHFRVGVDPERQRQVDLRPKLGAAALGVGTGPIEQAAHAAAVEHDHGVEQVTGAVEIAEFADLGDRDLFERPHGLGVGFESPHSAAERCVASDLHPPGQGVEETPRRPRAVGQAGCGRRR